MKCPACDHSLVKTEIDGTAVLACTDCHGVWFKNSCLVEFLSRTTGNQTMSGGKNRLSFSAPGKTGDLQGFCPECNQVAKPFSTPHSGISILKCVNCGGFWVKPSQLSRLQYWWRHAGPTERLAFCKGAGEPGEFFSAGPFWKSLFGLIEDQVQLKNFPYLTLSIIILNTLIFAGSFFHEERFQIFLLIPELVQKDPGKYWITLMTSMFLHADIIHLLGNMYFLWIFGDNLEDRMGRFNYLCFYISGGFIAGIAHTLATSQPQIPTLGASGAISAVMGGYLVLYPKTRIKSNFLLFFRPVSIRWPVWTYLGVWFFGMQLLYAYLDVPGVAWFDHIGGFVFGFCTVAAMRKFDML